MRGLFEFLIYICINATAEGTLAEAILPLAQGTKPSTNALFLNGGSSALGTNLHVISPNPAK